MYFFGGVAFDSGRCHNRLFRLDLCVMRMVELVIPDPLPSPRALPFIEVYQDDLFMAGGHPTFPFYEGWRTADDAWFFNLKSQTWKAFNVQPLRLSNVRSINRHKNKVCIVHQPKGFEIYTINLSTYSTSRRVAANPAWVPPGVP
jgi:hypothetical protein